MIDIFENAKPQSGEFFKFKEVGDSIQGTYVNVREGVDSFGNDQIIYILQDASGKIWNIGFRKTSEIITERMRSISFGTIVGFKFDEHRDSKRNPGTKAKIIRIYADPKFVDHDWLKQQKELEAKFGSPTASQAVRPVSPSSPKERLEEEFPEFDAPLNAKVAGGNLPTAEVSQRNEAVDAIRNLAKTKGLTNDTMSEEEADKVVEQYTGFPLVEENLTKVIIKLTGYVSK